MLPTTSDEWDAVIGDDDLFAGNLAGATGVTAVPNGSGFYTVGQYWEALGDDGRSFVTNLADQLVKDLYRGGRHSITAGYLHDDDQAVTLGTAHGGIDIAAARYNDDVHCLISGTVKYTASGTAGARDCVIVEGVDGNLWVYGCVTPSANVKVGAKIVAGQRLGTTDDYGPAGLEGDHVHLEVQPGRWEPDEMSDGHTWGRANSSGGIASPAVIAAETMSPLEAYYNAAPHLRFAASGGAGAVSADIAVTALSSSAPAWGLIA